MTRALALGLLGAAAAAAPARAYTAAGDRIFPASILLPQVAPSDETYLTTSTQPTADGRATSLSGVFDKSLTERWGIAIEDGDNWLDRPHASSRTGWQNLELTVRYLAVVDQTHEFLLSAGVDREFGGTGARGIGADPHGATTPTLYFAKGLGDLDIGYLRPLAVTGTLGYQVADAAPRGDTVVTGIALEYSIPYLESKVASLALPAVLRTVTPMVEFLHTSATTSLRNNPSVGQVAPGFNYAGEGWEFGIEALLPVTRAGGTGPGVTAQLHLSLDFLFASSIGRPLFGEH